MQLDAVIIGGDVPREMSKTDPFRLSLNGEIASIDFLQNYFSSGKDFIKACEITNQIKKTRFPVSINGPYLQQFLRHKGFTVELIPIFLPYKEQLIDILHEKPLCVVISTTFLNSIQSIESIASFVKEHLPDTKIIAGGIKIWKAYKKKLLIDEGEIVENVKLNMINDNYLLDINRHSDIDYFVISDRGEMTLAGLINCIKEEGDFTQLNNIGYFSENVWHINKITEEFADKQKYEVKVDWGSVPVDISKSEIPIRTGMGCRFRCKFCDFSMLQGTHKRSVESTIEEIRSIPIVDSFRNVFFVDDNLFVSANQTKEFCKKIINANLSLRWRSFVRIDSITRETAELMYKSGCKECLLGIESGDPEILKSMNKSSSPEKILNAVNLLNELGIHTQSTIVIGFPGETDNTIKNTINLLNAYSTNGTGLHFFYPFLFLVFPLSPISSPANRKKYNLKGYLDNWSHRTMDSNIAREKLVTLCDNISLNINPIYLENRIIPWMSIDNQKRMYYLRNKINRINRGILAEEDNKLWNELENIFLNSNVNNKIKKREMKDILANSCD